MIKDRKRVWGAFAVSLILNYVCGSYFEIGRTNIIYSLCYLLAGGLIYQYRMELEQFSRKNQWISLELVVITALIYYLIGDNTITMLLVSGTLLVYALGNPGGGVLENSFTKFFSSISMEAYLSHMVIFRLVEKVGFNKMVGNGWIQYVITVVIVLVGTVVFAVVVQKVLQMIGKRLVGKGLFE